MEPQPLYNNPLHRSIATYQHAISLETTARLKYQTKTCWVKPLPEPRRPFLFAALLLGMLGMPGMLGVLGTPAASAGV